ncbi:MAG TPA: lactonase family protein [Planctomycetota bacterium]|nr:lactonase family protein [Planctomycetota bacterium]
MTTLHDAYHAYIGTYTRNGSEGIYRLRFDARTGDVELAGVTKGVENPSFLALHPNGRFLYAVEETGRYEGEPTGAVSAFAIDPQTGELRHLARRPSGGSDPCHLSVAPDGSHLLVANYTGGSVARLSLALDGTFGETIVKKHDGRSVDPRRQRGPHAHWIDFTRDGRLALACDLGLDQVLIYDSRSGLEPSRVPFARVEPGSGPRHAAFSPTGDVLHVIGELDSTITTFAFDAEHGLLGELGVVSTLPPSFSGSSSTAEIAVHPTRGFVYGSNRGHDSIAVFAPVVDPATGRTTLRAVEIEPTGGRTPRSFGIEPGGRFLLALNQDSSSVIVFAIDAETGALSRTGTEIEVPMPVSIVFLPLAPKGE